MVNSPLVKCEAETRECAHPEKPFSAARLRREWRTITVMIACYCIHHHSPSTDLCPECRQLQDYAHLRLERCRFGADKPTCAKCPVHCYQPQRRDQIRAVMRFAGPRMLFAHPILSLWHWIYSFKRVDYPA